MSEDRNMVIPKTSADAVNKEVELMEDKTKAETVKEPITQEEADFIEKAFFEDDDTVRLRDGKTYRIPPLGLLDGRKLMKRLNTIDTGIIISNLMIQDGEEEDRFDALMEVLLMAFKPYYMHMTTEYLGEYVDLVTAKQIIDSMIGLNGLKKLL